jgi:hypothetical protein
MRVVYTKFPESKIKLDIKLLFFSRPKLTGKTDLQEFETEIIEAGKNPGVFLNTL